MGDTGAPGPEPPDRNCPWCGAPGPCAVTFEIPGKPRGKPAARAGSVGGRARLMAGKDQRGLESRIRDGFYRARPDWTAGDVLPGPVRVRIIAVQALPKTRGRKREPVPASWHTGKPDWDNVGKAVGDALNGIAWRDDAEIVDGQALTIVGPQGAPARTVVCMTTAPPVETVAPSWVLSANGEGRIGRGIPSVDGEELQTEE